MQDKKIEFAARDFTKQPLTREELEEIIDGRSVGDFLNTRHEVYKNNNWKEKPPTKSQAIAEILKDNKVIRRPIIRAGGRFVVGFDKEAYSKLK